MFITNFLPSARAKLRVDPEDLWAVNPRLVYAKGHGQGQRGPDADLGGFDAVSYWSRGGVGHILTPADGPMIMQRGAMGDAPSGAMLAGGVAAALYQRERTGKGSVVDVALLNTAVWQLGVDLTATTILREEPQQAATAAARSPNPLVGPYTTADDRYLLLNMLDDTRHWAPTCRALGLDELVDDPRFADTAARADERATSCTTDRRERDRLAARSPISKTRLDAEDTIFSALASPLEVDRRPAGRRQRLPRAASRPPDGPPGRARRCSSTTRWSRSGAARPRWASTPTRCSPISATPPTRSTPCARSARSLRRR